MTTSPRNLLSCLFTGGFVGFIANWIPPLAGHLPPGVGTLFGIAVAWMLMRPAPDWRTVACIANELPWSRRIIYALPWSVALFIAVTAINIPCTQIASRFIHSIPSHPFLDATRTLNWNAIPVAAISLCIITPVSEELFFRRLMPGALQAVKLTEKKAYVLAALFFAAIHMNPAAFLGLFAFGLALSWQIKKHDLIQSILIHSFYNTCVLLVVIVIKLTQANGG